MARINGCTNSTNNVSTSTIAITPTVLSISDTAANINVTTSFNTANFTNVNPEPEPQAEFDFSTPVGVGISSSCTEGRCDQRDDGIWMEHGNIILFKIVSTSPSSARLAPLVPRVKDPKAVIVSPLRVTTRSPEARVLEAALENVQGTTTTDVYCLSAGNLLVGDLASARG